MPPDCYRVEVLYCLNPHLIWVEVRDLTVVQGEFKFEQIGIYGVLPLETTIDLDDEEFTVQHCKEWLPAAANLMQQFLYKEEVWFSPTHIDRRSSIFDDNIHKFGDLIIKKPNGKTKSLSKLLRTSGFATYDACLFHQYLSAGKIKTKLSNAATQDVINEIEKYYLNKNCPKKQWKDPIKKQTSVFRATLQMEATLTTSNVDIHNQLTKDVLENKQRDLELCKGVDEESVGRASVRKGKKEPTALEAKLKLLNAKKIKKDSNTQPKQESQEYAKAFEDTKAFVEANASPNTQKINTKADAHKAQILRKIMCKSGKKITKQELLVKRLINESKDKDKKPAEAVEKPPTGNQSDDSSSTQSDSSLSSISEHDEIPNVVKNEPQQSNSNVDPKITSKRANLESNLEPNTAVDVKSPNVDDSVPSTSATKCKQMSKNDKPGPSTSGTKQEQLSKVRNSIPSKANNGKQLPKTVNTVRSTSGAIRKKSSKIDHTEPSSTSSKKGGKSKRIINGMKQSNSAPNQGKSRGNVSQASTSKPEEKEHDATPSTSDDTPKASSKEGGKEEEKDLKPESTTALVPYTGQCNGASSNTTSRNHSNDQACSNSDKLEGVPNTKSTEEANSNPPDDHMVNTLMHRFKLNGSKHSDMIKKAISKSNNGKNNRAAIEALHECRDKIIGEIRDFKRKKHRNNDCAQNKSIGKPKKKKKKKGRKGHVKRSVVKTAYGPPGIDLTKLNCRVPPIHLYDEGGSTEQTAGPSSKRNDVDDSNENNDVVDNEPVPSCSYDTRQPRHRHDRKDISSSCSSMLERRLKLHKEMAKNKRCASHTSDTMNKDSSNQEEKAPPKNLKRNTGEESDESISDLMDMLVSNHIGETAPAADEDKDKDKKKGNNDTICQQVAVNANPFQNFDPHMSVFVDKLITPIMLVHSKMNKRFAPASLYRDINFSDHVRLVLQNLGIRKPMMLQTITWPSILRGYSVFMISSAASGKTIGYLPAVCRLVSDYSETVSDGESVGPLAIIVCATSQSVSDVDKLAKMLVGCNEKVVSCYYGHDEVSIATSLLNGCNLLISTAPSLMRLLQLPEFGLDLRRLATFVLDDCERLSEVYLPELKFCFHKIKDMLKKRVNKELKVQFVVASRIWCDFMEPFAKVAPDTVVCIGAFQESVLYGKAKMTVSYVKNADKLDHLMKFLEDVDPSKRTVVVCDTDEEVEYLNTAIQAPKYFIFAANNTMTVQDLYNLSMLWKEFREPMMAPVLICCDSNLYHMNVIDAHYLIQYSMPSLFSIFCRRFATLNDSYPSIFKNNDQLIKILILLEEHNVEQFPKIISFLKRCSTNVPDFVDGICKTVIAERDAKKAEGFSPLCNTMLTLGACPDLYNCGSRHTIHKLYDKPKDWVPKSGTVIFEILHFHSAAHYSVRLISHDQEKYYPSYSSISLKVGVHYSSLKNRILFGIPKVGDICAVALRENLFARCQVIKIIDRYEKGKAKTVLVLLLDEELIEITTDTNLYHLPDDLKDLNTFVVHVRLANIKPRDRDVVFSELARDQVKDAIEQHKRLYMKGQIALTVGNCLFLDTLEACQDLKSFNESVVTYNVKKELLEKHAEVNPEHIPKIEELCLNSGLNLKSEEHVPEVVTPIKETVNVTWAFMDGDETTVYFRSAEDPETIFVRLTKFDDCLKILIKDIQKYAAVNTRAIQEFKIGDIVLAKYPDDSMFERARVDEVLDDSIKCFFVDQGEWSCLSKDNFIPIDDKLITQLPFQAIECRLIAVKPVGDEWTEFSTNWVCDKCYETHNGGMKQLYAKHVTKELAKHTGGDKYGIILIDTYGETDMIINKEMIKLNLAKGIDEETKHFDYLKPKEHLKVSSNDEEEDDWEKISNSSVNSRTSQRNLSPSNILLRKPIRSVPLVGSDYDSDESDKWNVNMTDDLAKMFKPFIQTAVQKPKSLEIENDEAEDVEQVDLSALARNIEACTRHFQLVKLNQDTSKELDSDDFSSSETCQSGSAEKTDPIVEECQLRKPKLNWRQTKTTVTIKIHLIGVEHYTMEIQDRAIKFNATVNDTEYGFEFDLYGVIDSKNASHANKGQYILVKFDKIMKKIWLTLTKDGGIRKWIVYDVDSIDLSSDEEETQDESLFNIVKNMHNKSDSDTDEEEIVDDVNFTYKANV